MKTKLYYIVAKTKEEKEKAFDIFKKAGYKYIENYHPDSPIICTDSDGSVYNSALYDEEWYVPHGYEKYKEKASSYMVVIKGRGEPRKKHATLEEAKLEAERLSKLEGRDAIILKVVGEVSLSFNTNMYE